MKKKLYALAFLIPLLSFSQDFDFQLKTEVREAIEDLRDFNKIPNNSLEHSDIMRNITWLTQKFNERGFNSAVLETEGEPLFFAVRPIVQGLPTVLFYMHFDGQPVDPSKWDQPNPYEVVLKRKEGDNWQQVDWAELDKESDMNYDMRLFGRSVSDDKGPIVMMLNAIDLLKKNNKEIPFNVKVILDSEEERSSKPLPNAVKKYRELLQADFLIINDGPLHPSEKPTLVFGCRGITTVNLTTYGPVKPQHSGHYGNYAPNPGFQLSQLLASMKDKDGKVIVKGYYDGISLDEKTKEVLNSVPDDEKAIRERLAFKSPEKVGQNYQEALQYPSLNVRGLSSGWTGAQARTIVPDKATAAIDIRLVPESDGNKLKDLIKKHIQAEGYYVTDKAPTQEERMSHDKIVTFESGTVTPAFRTSLDDNYAKWVEDVLKNTFNEDVVKIRIMGGTVPTAAFINELNIPAVIVPMVNPDNNQHSPNENLRIWQISYGIEAFYNILSTAVK
ncbi:M20/M25/M40 family metallo-hydrolase [Leptobacterium flavescens]|uniref:M20/M25/M40 family metallo-hydrolase n=1 Tax=Leptobacterium flavescens TaxID=472055 RepID=A0A6P0UII6_9FLAO|nr:M20/M25/M40 family metallo-hydrolase [Leptobacterium flavescens]NER12342.1 M20/M25/M40 family metallo-hydrolase [Leptobacterium flavescens]